MKVIKDSAIYLIGELISKAMPFLLLPYLSRKLGVEGFGELAYYQTLLYFLLIILGLSQDGAIARYFYFYGKRSLDLIVTVGYCYTLFWGCIMIGISYYLKLEILFYLILIAIFQSFISVQLSIRQCQKQAIPYTLIQFLSALILLITTVVMLEYYKDELVEKRILAILFSNIFVFSISYFIYKSKNKYKLKWKNSLLALSYILSFGVPLLFHHISFFLRGQLDRIFIYHNFSESDLGLYAMGAQIAAILMVLIQAVNKALLPYFYEALKNKKITLSDIHKWAFYSLTIVPIPAFIAYILPEHTILWMLGSKFLGVKYYLVLFLLATSLTIPYLILVNYLFYHGENKIISLCSILSTVTYLVFLFLLMTFEIKYIPYASILGALVILPIFYIATKKLGEI